MKTLSFFLISFFLFSCNSNQNSAVSYAVKSQNINSEKSNSHKGKKLMETHCYVCHSPTANHDERLAPPMIAIKKHYLKKTTTKEEFTTAIQNWIKNPNEDDAKMRGAIRRFGVMPKQAFPDETIEHIADYMFSNEIEQPEWFEEHFKNNKKRGM